MRGMDNGPWTGMSYHQGAFYVSEGGEIEGGRILRVRLLKRQDGACWRPASPAISTTSSAMTCAGRVALSGTRPGIRRIQRVWYAA